MTDNSEYIINEYYKYDITIPTNSTTGIHSKNSELIFNKFIVDVCINITIDNFNSIPNQINLESISNELIYYHNGFITCLDLYSYYKYINDNEYDPDNIEQKIDLPNNLKFYFRYRLSRVHDNSTYSYHILDENNQNENLLRHIIPHNYDNTYQTYEVILEKKNNIGRFNNIMMNSWPHYAIIDYKHGYLYFNQENTQNIDNLKYFDENDELFLTFIRYEGNFGAVTGGGSTGGFNTEISFNLSNWSDASFNNIDVSNLITIYNNLNFSDLCDNNVATKYQIKQLAENNFFFFFQSKPWPPIYLDGCYNIPYSYNYGNISSSLNYSNYNISDTSFIFYNNLNLYFKIPRRREITWNYNNDENINYVPEYNSIIIQYRDNSNNINFTDLYNLSNIEFFDASMQFNIIFNIDRSVVIDPEPSITHSLTADNSINININSGSGSIFNQLCGYQFRIYITNTSLYDISRTPGYKINQYYEQDPSWNYLYFPDISNSYFVSLSKGKPNPPTNISFINKPTDQTDYYQSFNIEFYNYNTYVDVNNIQPLNSNDISLVYNLDLTGIMSATYRRAIDFSSYNIDLSFENLTDPSFTKELNNTIENPIRPEFNYILQTNSYFINYLNAPDFSASDPSNIDMSIIIPIPYNNFNYNTLSDYEISNNKIKILNDISNDTTNNYRLTTKFNQNYPIIFTDQSLNFIFNIDTSNIKIGDTRTDNTNDISLGKELIDNSLQQFNFNILEISNSQYIFYENSLNILLTDFSITDISNNYFLQNKFNGFIKTTIKDNFPNIQENRSHYYLHGDLCFNFNYILYKPNDISFYNYLEISFNQYNYINNSYYNLTEVSLNPSLQDSYIHVIPDSSDVSYNPTDQSFNYKIILDNSWGIIYDFSDTLDIPNKNYNIRSFDVSQIWNYSVSADFSLGSLNNIGKCNIDLSSLVRYYFNEQDKWYNNNDWLIKYYLNNKTNKNQESADICNIIINGINDFNDISYTIIKNYDFSLLEQFTIKFDISYIDNLFSVNHKSNKNTNSLILDYSISIDFSYGGWSYYAYDASAIYEKITLKNNPHKNEEYYITFDNINDDYSFNKVIDFCHNTTNLKYNQIMYGGNNNFTAGNSNEIYKKYKYPTDISYYGRVIDFSSFDYELLNNSGDVIKFNVPSKKYFYDNTNTDISGIYKWLTFKIYNSNSYNTLVINSPNDSSNILYYLVYQINSNNKITSIGNGNIAQRDIGTYFIPTNTNDICNNFNIWMPLYNYVSITNDNKRYLSIPQDSCNNLYLITGLPNNSNLTFSEVSFDFSDISFGIAKTANVEIILNDNSNIITISGGITSNTSNITDNLPWPSENFIYNSNELENQVDYDISYEINYSMTFFGNMINTYKRGFPIDSYNYIITLSGNNLTSNSRYFSISYENIANPEYIYSINNLITLYIEDLCYNSQPLQNYSISFDIPTREIIKLEENDISYKFIGYNESVSINTQYTNNTYFVDDLSLNIIINKSQLSIYRLKNNNIELIGNELYDKSLNNILLNVNQNSGLQLNLSNEYYNIGPSNNEFFNHNRSKEISYNFDISNKIIIYDNYNYDISYNRGYYLASDLSIDYIFNIDQPTSPNYLYNNNFDACFNFQYYVENSSLDLDLSNYNIIKEISKNYVLKRHVNSVEISFTSIDISLDVSEFGVNFEPSGSDFSFVYGVKKGWTFNDISKIDISYSFDLSINNIDISYFRYIGNDWSYNLQLIKNYNSDITTIYYDTSFNIGNNIISKYYELSDYVNSDISSIFDLNISANIVQNIGVNNDFNIDPSIIHIDTSINIIFNPTTILIENTSNAVNATNIEIIHKLSKSPFNEYYFYYFDLTIFSNLPNFPNLPFQQAPLLYDHDSSVNHGQCIFYDNNFIASGEPFQKLYYPQQLATNPNIEFKDYSNLSGFNISDSNLYLTTVPSKRFLWYKERITANQYTQNEEGTYNFIIKKIIIPSNLQYVLEFNNINYNFSYPDYVFLVNIDGYWIDCTFQGDASTKAGAKVTNIANFLINSNRDRSLSTYSTSNILKIFTPMTLNRIVNFYIAIGINTTSSKSIPLNVFENIVFSQNLN